MEYRAVVFDFYGVLTGSAEPAFALPEGAAPLDGETLACARELAQEAYALGICSNSSGAVLRKSLAAYGVEELFRALIVSGELGLEKPAPDMFAACALALSVSPAETIFVDDSAVNVEAATQIGMHGILFEGAAALRRELHELDMLQKR